MRTHEEHYALTVRLAQLLHGRGCTVIDRGLLDFPTHSLDKAYGIVREMKKKGFSFEYDDDDAGPSASFYQEYDDEHFWSYDAEPAWAICEAAVAALETLAKDQNEQLETDCHHDWKPYTGLTETFDYCSKCPAKKETKS